MSLNIAWVSPQRVLVAADSSIAGVEHLRGYSHNKLYPYPAQLAVMCGSGLASFVLGVHACLTSTPGYLEDFFEVMPAHIEAACSVALKNWRDGGFPEDLLEMNTLQSVFLAGWSDSAGQFLARAYTASIFDGRADWHAVKGNYARPWDDKLAKPGPLTTKEAIRGVARLQMGIMRGVIQTPGSPVFGQKECAGGKLIIAELRPGEMQISHFGNLEYEDSPT